MIILYKICFGQRVNDVDYERISSCSGGRPIEDSIPTMITVCLTSLVQQMEATDSIVFFLDGADHNNIISSVCAKYGINFKIKQFNHQCAVKINNETVLYIENEIKNNDEIIYLCEDDYLHYNNCLDRMKDFFEIYPGYFCHPIDYPNLYDEMTHLGRKAYSQASEIIVTKDWHWRRVKSTTMTFAFKRQLYTRYYNIFQSMTPKLFWEHIYNVMYIFDECYSPIPSLTSHLEHDCLPPCIDTKKIYDNIKLSLDRSNLEINDWIDIYNTGGYDNVGSGPGSLLKNNLKLIDWLTDFFLEERVTNILDLGCGDMQWVPELVRNTSCNYTGVDCVPLLIEKNTKQFPSLKFDCADILNYSTKFSSDLILLKDVIQHFNFEKVKTIIKNIDNINSTHKIIVVPFNIEENVEKYLINNEYKLVYKYLSDEVKKIFVKNPFTSTYVFKTCSDIYN